MKSAALAILFLVLSAGRAAGQSAPPTDPAAFLDWALAVRIQDRGWWAFTTCGSQPETWSNNEEIPDDFAGMVREHEAQHRSDMEAKGSCYAWHLWHYFGGRMADVETEARAFCAGARYDYGHGYTWVQALVRGARMFASYYPTDPTWTESTAIDAIVANCR